MAPHKKITTITQEQSRQLDNIRDKWLDIGLSERAGDRAAAESAMRRAYVMAKLEPPKVFIWIGSPLWGAYAVGAINNMKHDQVNRQVYDQVSAQVRGQVYDQVYDQVRGQVYDQVLAQVRAQVSDQVHSQVYDQVASQVDDQVRDQVNRQVYDQVYDQVHSQVYAQVYDQVSNQVINQVHDQVSDQVINQVHDQVSAQVYTQVRGQVSAQVYTQVRGQVSDQVLAQVNAQVSAQVYAQVVGQVYDQVHSQVDGQVNRQVIRQVYDQVHDQVHSQVYDQVDGQVNRQVLSQVNRQVNRQVLSQVDDQEKKRWTYARKQIGKTVWGQYQTWLSYYDAMAALGVRECERLRPLMDLAKHAGWCWPMHGVCVMTDRHESLFRDDAGRMHNETGPAIQWPDKYGIYVWHGTRVPGEWIVNRDTLNPTTIISWSNIEQRRAGCEIIGWDRVLQTLNAHEVNKDKNPQIGTLLRCNLPDAPNSQFLRVKCGTGRTFVLPVPPDMTTALQANAWTYDLPETAIKALQERT